MAKVQLDKAAKKEQGFSVWVAGMLTTTGRTQEDLAYYLNIDQSNLWHRLHGNTPWRLREYYEVQEFFSEVYEHDKI